MTATPQLLTADHIDLLITAALRWRILTDLTTAAFTPTESHLVVATATEAARILQQENLAALRWLSDRGRSRLADRAVPDPHLFSEVDALDPVEVIKACHAAQYLCSSAPGWAGSTAHRLLAAISTAATHRLPGYAEAPWIWTRPQVRAGRPVALGSRWRPELPGISWVSVAELITVWQSAALVVITTGAAADLPVGLPARSGLFLLAGSDPPDEVWDAVAAASPEAVLYWPACSDWLAEQAHDPSSRFTHHRGGELA